MADPASPFDMSSFIAFPTSGGGGPGGLGPSPQADEMYKAFARGIRETQMNQAQAKRVSGGSQQERFAYPMGTGTGGQGNVRSPSGTPLMKALGGLQPASNSPKAMTPRQSSMSNGTPRPSSSSNSDHKNSPHTASDGGQISTGGSALSPYGLDPAAFQSEVRFQLPAFLNPNASTSTHPNGAEVWSGYGLNSTVAMEGMYNATAAGAPLRSGYNTGSEGLGGFGFEGKLEGQSGMVGDDNWTFGNDYKGLTSTGMYGFPPHPGMVSPLVVALVNGFIPNPQQMQAFQQHPDQRSASFPHGKGPPSMSVAIPNHPQPSKSTPTMPTSALLPPAGSAAWPGSGDGYQQGTMQPTMNQPGNPISTNAFASSSSLSNAVPAAAILAQSNNLNGLVQPDTLAVTNQIPANGNASMPGLYSQTGFDMIGVLARVAARRDPKTVLGPVDCSCSFLVVDIRKFDHPIVYASPTFQQLTGYDASEIIGKNCRFLQSPDGEVARGSRRKYTDNVAVSHLKRMLLAGKECQASLINYRKGGTPFINLVTVVPIPWDGDDIVYHVGFQVDLVEQPNAILRNMRDGTYSVNYTTLNPPQLPMRPAPKLAPIEHVPVSTGLPNDILDVMGPRAKSNIYAGHFGEDSGKMEWLKCVLEQMDDFVLVLSLKGQFQYVAPAVRRVLEYEPEDLVNKHISDICHPSDIVPVMRELKDSTHAPLDGQNARLVNLLCRVRRKRSGYVWLECTGRLHVEPGKGRKAVILSGRERAMSNLSWSAIDKHGGLANLGFWTRLSFDGMVLWASEQVAEVLGSRVEDVIGRSYYSFLQGGAEVAPPSALPHKGAHHPHATSIEQALLKASEGLPKKGATTVQHQLVGSDGRIVNVTAVFYAVVSEADVFDIPAQDSPDSADSDAAPNGHVGIAGCPPNQIVVQVKVTHSPQLKLKGHELSDNVFEELDTTRGTSWQYEIHQLKTANRRLREEITIQSGMKNRSNRLLDEDRQNKKKRKVGDTTNEMPPPSSPMPVPTADHPVPLHQQTLGFGLMPPSQTLSGWS